MKRHIIAVFVLWHGSAMLASALPSPGAGLNRSYWSDPTVQAEFGTWARMLGVESQALQDDIFVVAQRVQSAVEGVRAPFKPWLDLTRTRQSWKMFVAPHRFPTRLQLRVASAGGEWRVVYEEDRPEAQWMARRFGNERVRASVFAWGWPAARTKWKSACTGFARALFDELPDAARVQCRFAKITSPSAAEVLAGQAPAEKWVMPLEVSREGGGA